MSRQAKGSGKGGRRGAAAVPAVSSPALAPASAVTSLEVPAATTPAAVTCDTNALQQVTGLGTVAVHGPPGATTGLGETPQVLPEKEPAGMMDASMENEQGAILGDADTMSALEAAPLEAAAIAASGLRTSPPKATPLDTAGIGASELSTSVAMAVSPSRALLTGPKASPQKRKLTPQTVTAPRGRILQSSSSATGVDAVVYLLTTNASLLCQSFPDQYHGYAIAWSSQERNHSTLWQQYLQQEQFTEDSLREEYFVVHRQGPGPMYLRTLLSAGDLSNALSIMENFFLYLKENGHRLEHVRLYNAGDQDLTAWQQDSSLPDLKLLPQEQIPMEFSPLKVGLLERRPDLVLTAVATTEATCYQFRLGGHCWPFRAALGAWHGGFVDGNGDQVAKGSPNSSYARWTPPFPASELKHWLTTLHDTILEVKVIGALEPHVATILSETKFLIIKK